MSDPPGPTAVPALTVRRVRLEYPNELDPAWTPSIPEFACAANSVSLLMPHMEPYFVRSVAAVIDRLDDDLADQARAYIGQEAEHHRQHHRFNRHLTDRYPALAQIERLAAAAYSRLGRRASPEFNVAVAAASETIAYSAARWSAERRRELFTGADPVVATLFLWHLAEEVEHKAVAWDVHVAVGNRRRHYLAAALVGLVLVMGFVGAGTVVMLVHERRWWHPIAWLRLGRWAVTFAFELLSNLVVSVLGDHHPDRFADPVWYELWLREHDAATDTVPLWTEG